MSTTVRLPFRSPFSMLALTGLVAAGFILRSLGGGPEEAADPIAEDCAGLTDAECEAFRQAVPAQPSTGQEVLRKQDVCPGTGYLCAEVETEGNLRLLRWSEETQMIRIWIPEPDHLPAAEARAFQQAAARGIRAWDGHPIPLSIRARGQDEGADFAIQWSQTLPESRLGRAQVEWSRRGSLEEMRVVGFQMVTRHPSAGRDLTPEEVELVAAHEMGHVLGLPHSDDPRDVMYPRNTSHRLTARDFRTLEALYALPAGAEIRR